jgi:hypothetical protein
VVIISVHCLPFLYWIFLHKSCTTLELFKVHILWEGHNLMQSSVYLWIYLITSKLRGRLRQFCLPSQKTWILNKGKSEFLNRFWNCWTVCTRGTRAGFAWPLVCYLESTCSRREIEIRYSHSVSFYKDWNNNLITGLICQFFISFRVN